MKLGSRREHLETFFESKSRNFIALRISGFCRPLVRHLLSMAAAPGARFVGNHRLCSEEDLLFLNLNRRVLPIKRSAPPDAISHCIAYGVWKFSMKAVAKLRSISRETVPAWTEAGGEQGRARALSVKTMERWMRDSVVEIVQNLGESSSLLAEVYTEGDGGKFRLKIQRAGAEDWPEIQEEWNNGERSLPDGIIVVEELKDEAEVEEDAETKDEERFWGLMVQGKGFDCAPCCYILKTNRRSTNLQVSCTYFVLIKVRNFNESAKSQVDTSFLVD